MSQAPVIVIGSGVAGWTTIRELRKLDPSTPVVLVTGDSGDFYAKPSLSNAYAQRRSPAQLVSTPAQTMAQAQQVRLMPHSVVEQIDIGAQRITLRQDGALHTLDYRQLVLATGAQPVRVPLRGDAADTLHSINNLNDFAAFHAALGVEANAELPAPNKTMLILGAGTSAGLARPLADRRRAGSWCFIDEQGRQRGFALTGTHTSRRMDMARRTLP